MTRENEPETSIEEAMEVERRSLDRLTRFHPRTRLSGRLLRAHNRVGRFVSGDRDLFHHEKLVVITSAGISPWLFYDLARAALPEPAPAEILRQLCRDPAHVCAEPFLLELNQDLEILRRLPVVDGEGESGFPAQVAEIEELRNLSVALAREQAGSLVLSLLDRTRSKTEVPRGLVGQLALAIGVWAGLCWRDRRFFDSCDAYCSAFDLAAVDGSASLLIQLKQRAAHLIADSGFMDYSRVWLQEAVAFFASRGESEAQGKAMVDLGRIHFLEGHLQTATDLFERALDLLPLDSFRYRVAALEALSNCFQEQQDPAKAAHTLDQAFAEYGDRRDSYLGYLAWVRGRLLGEAGKTAAAEASFNEAVDLLHRFGGPLAAELAMLDFSDFRVLRGQSTKDIGEHIMRSMKEGRYDSRSAQVAAKMVSSLLWGKPTKDEIARLRRSLEQAGGVTCPPRLKVD